MNKLICIAAALIMSINHASAQELLLKSAPAIKVKTMLQTGRGWKSELKGKVVVLEFWATWCTPCMANLAHLNELCDQFAGSKVQFISITQEPEERISQFLQKRVMNGWVAIDSAGKTFKNYGVTFIPHTFIIDSKGIIRFSGEPSQVTKDVIQDILNGSYTPEVAHYKEAIKLGGWSPGDDPVFTANFNSKETKILYQNTIRQSTGSGGTGTKTGGGYVGITLLHQSLPSIIAFTEEMPSTYRVVNRSSIPDTAKWDVIFSRNKGYDLPRALKELNETISDAFSISWKDSAIKKHAYVPEYTPLARVMEEKNIDFDKPETHTYRSLKDIYDKMERENGELIAYPTNADTRYLDIFDIITTYHKMTANELKAWLVQQGFSFAPKEMDVAVKVVVSK